MKRRRMMMRIKRRKDESKEGERCSICWSQPEILVQPIVITCVMKETESRVCNKWTRKSDWKRREKERNEDREKERNEDWERKKGMKTERGRRRCGSRFSGSWLLFLDWESFQPVLNHFSVTQERLGSRDFCPRVLKFLSSFPSLV